MLWQWHIWYISENDQGGCVYAFYVPLTEEELGVYTARYAQPHSTIVATVLTGQHVLGVDACGGNG